MASTLQEVDHHQYLSSCVPPNIVTESIPISKWNLDFDGNSSLLAFLETVEQL